MAEAKTTGRAVVPAGGGSDDIDTALRGVEGKVRKAVVEKLRRLVDRDPEAFVRNMRTWMDQGRSDIE
jgi:flagellar biosynthesis/type III secretory pathway M-ring protein FliF/YscJ